MSEGNGKLLHEALTGKIIDAAIEVHRHLGPGLLENTYEACLCHELARRGIAFRRQVALPVRYKGELVECGYRIDVLVEETVIVELKSVQKTTLIDEAQLLTHLKLSGIPVGLLINFNVTRLIDGLTRRANTSAPKSPHSSSVSPASSAVNVPTSP